MPSQVFVLTLLRSGSSVFVGSVYRKIFHYNRCESVKCCTNGLGRMDLVHILAFHTLKFWKNLGQSTNRTLYNTSMCFRRECDYMILLLTYSCTTTDNIAILKSKVLEHYTSICAAREVTGRLCFVCVYIFVCLYVCMCVFVYISCM